MLVQVVCMWDLPTYRENVAGKYSVGWDACMYVGSRCVGESTCYIETDTNVCSCSLHVCFGGVFFLFFLSTSEEICVSSCVLHSGLQGIGRWIDRRDFFCDYCMYSMNIFNVPLVRSSAFVVTWNFLGEISSKLVMQARLSPCTLDVRHV